MAEHGFTPEQALVAATSSAAELMGLQDELGTLEPGKRADVVVVDGDPFDVRHAEGPDRTRSGRTASGSCRSSDSAQLPGQGIGTLPGRRRPILAA